MNKGYQGKDYQGVGQFVQAINKEIVSAIISRQPVPLHPEKSFTCFMADTRVSFDINVNAQGEVTDSENVAARLRFEFRYIPEKARDQSSDNTFQVSSSPSEFCPEED